VNDWPVYCRLSSNVSGKRKKTYRIDDHRQGQHVRVVITQFKSVMRVTLTATGAAAHPVLPTEVQEKPMSRIMLLVVLCNPGAAVHPLLAQVQTRIEGQLVPGKSVSPDQLPPPTITATTLRITLSDGTILDIPRKDLIHIGNFTWDHAVGSDGRHTYTYVLDNTQVQLFRVGDNMALLPKGNKGTGPKGWGFYGMGFVADGIERAERTAGATYTISTAFRPGLVAVYLQGETTQKQQMTNEPPVHKLKSIDNIAITRADGIFTNSLKKYAIGPAFAANVSKQDVLDEVQIWIKYGFSFLQPLIDDGVLNNVRPQTDLETQIVACLKDVLKDAK
jgi:hypothetical protein